MQNNYQSSPSAHAVSASSHTHTNSLQTKFCQVCFVNTNRRKFDQSFNFVTCSNCQKSAHKGCYNNTIFHHTFQCEACRFQRNIDEDVCYYCHNEGLLKYIGKQKFAHPVCFLFYGEITAINYQTLEVQIKNLDLVEQSQQEQCQICLRSSHYLENCHEAGCSRRAHYYCTMKNNASQQDNPWSSLLTFQNHGFANTRIRCPDHIKYCSCQKTLPENVNYIMCDQCMRWYHQPCQGVKVAATNQDQPYYCKLCKKWDNITEKDLFFLKSYPQLFIYDFLKILRVVCNNLNNSKLLKVLEKFPFECCTISFNHYNSRLQVNKKVQQAIELLALSDTEHGFRSVQIDSSLAQYLFEQYKGKQGKTKYWNYGSHNESNFTVVQFYKMLKTLNLKKIASNHPPIEQFCQLYSNPFDYELNLENIIKFYKNILKDNYRKEFDIQSMFESFAKAVFKVQKRCDMKNFHPPNTQQNNIFFLLFALKKMSQQDLKNYISAFNIFLRIKQQAQKSYLQLKNKQSRISTDEVRSIIYRISNYIENLVIPTNLKMFIKKDFKRCVRLFEGLCTRQAKKIDKLTHQLESLTSIQISNYEQIIAKYQLSVPHLEKEYYIIKIMKHQFERIVMANNMDDHSILKIRRFIKDQKDAFVIKISKEDLKVFEDYLLQFQKIDQVVGLLLKEKEKREKPKSFFEQTLNMPYYTQKISYIDKYVETNAHQLPDICSLIVSLNQIQLSQPFYLALSKYITYFINSLKLSSYPAIKFRSLLICCQFLSIKSQKLAVLRLKNSSYQSWFKTYVACYNVKKLNIYFEDFKEMKELKYRLDQGLAVQRQELNIQKQKDFLRQLLLWCHVTMKISQVLKAKPLTSQIVKEMMQIMIDSMYPVTISYYDVMYQLHEQCLQTQRILDIVIKKINFVEMTEVQVSQQLEYVQSKIKIQEVKDFFETLQNSKIDWDIEIRMIEQQILYFNFNQRHAQKAIAENNHKQQIEFHKFFLHETPFCYDNFYELREKTMISLCSVVPSTKKQFDRIVNWGGKELQNLYHICKQKRLAHNQLDKIESSLVGANNKPFPSLAELETVYNNLFQKDPKKVTITKWVNEFYLLEEICRSIESQNNNRLYSVEQLQQTLLRYEKVPIRSQIKKILFEKIKKYYMILGQIKQPNLYRWLHNQRKIEDMYFNKILELFKLLESQKLMCKQYQNISNQINIYQKLINQDIQTYKEYINFLRQCHLIGQKFLSKKFVNIRAQHVVQNRKNIKMCKNSEQLKEYHLQCVILSTTSMRYDDAFIEELSDIMRSIESFKLQSNRKDRSRQKQSEISSERSRWDTFSGRSKEKKQKPIKQQEENEEEDDIMILEENNIGNRIIQIKQEQIDSD